MAFKFFLHGFKLSLSSDVRKKAGTKIKGDATWIGRISDMLDAIFHTLRGGALEGPRQFVPGQLFFNADFAEVTEDGGTLSIRRETAVKACKEFRKGDVFELDEMDGVGLDEFADFFELPESRFGVNWPVN